MLFSVYVYCKPHTTRLEYFSKRMQLHSVNQNRVFGISKKKFSICCNGYYYLSLWIWCMLGRVVIPSLFPRIWVLSLYITCLPWSVCCIHQCVCSQPCWLVITCVSRYIINSFCILTNNCINDKIHIRNCYVISKCPLSKGYMIVFIILALGARITVEKPTIGLDCFKASWFSAVRVQELLPVLLLLLLVLGRWQAVLDNDICSLYGKER